MGAKTYINMTDQTYNFSAANASLQRHVDSPILPGVSTAIIKNGQLIDSFCTGFADIERGEALRPDHIHRAYSCTKLMTSVLVMLLVDQGYFALDDAIKKWIPAFGQLRVLRAGATSLADTVPLQTDITIRHLLSHQAGFSHGVFDPDTLIYSAYAAAGVRKPDSTLEQLMDQMAALPLIYQPGTSWQYSMATDVVGRLVEIVTGQSMAEAFKTRLFEPLGMVDTAYLLREDQIPRLATLYAGHPMTATKPGLHRLDNMPWPNAFIKPVPRQAASSGLVTTQADLLALLSQLLRGNGNLLKAETLAELLRDQLPANRSLQFAQSGQMLIPDGPVPSLGFSLCGAVTRTSSDFQPNTPVGEVQWGGLAGPHWWISPATGTAGVLMTQRFMGFWNPFWFEYKQRMHAVLNESV
jgi:CubicO group peptidase (beta-lactamase class C family)